MKPLVELKMIAEYIDTASDENDDPIERIKCGDANLGDSSGMGIYSVIVTTCADMKNAKETAKTLITNHLAACVQMLPVESIYTWQGKLCEENEIVLIIKTKTVLLKKIIRAIKENHPYEVPEIIQLPIIDGLPDYLRWIDGCV